MQRYLVSVFVLRTQPTPLLPHSNFPVSLFLSFYTPPSLPTPHLPPHSTPPSLPPSCIVVTLHSLATYGHKAVNIANEIEIISGAELHCLKSVLRFVFLSASFLAHLERLCHLGARALKGVKDAQFFFLFCFFQAMSLPAVFQYSV